MTTAFAAGPRTPEKKPAASNAMRFFIVRSTVCSDICPEWIAAQGDITADTPALLKKVIKKIGDRKIPVVLSSGGGDVLAAYSMGRMIRKAGLETAVGYTVLKDCTGGPCNPTIDKDGFTAGRSLPDKGTCYSACPLVLAGGAVRSSPIFGRIGLHQITKTWNEMKVTYRIQYKMVNGKKQEVSRTEVARKFVAKRSTTKLTKKSVARLTDYLKEMGVSTDIVDVMMSTTPDDIRLVRPAAALEAGLITDILSEKEWPGMSLCAQDAAEGALCHRRTKWSSVPATIWSAEPDSVKPDPAKPEAESSGVAIPAPVTPVSAKPES